MHAVTQFYVHSIAASELTIYCNMIVYHLFEAYKHIREYGMRCNSCCKWVVHPAPSQSICHRSIKIEFDHGRTHVVITNLCKHSYSVYCWIFTLTYIIPDIVVAMTQKTAQIRADTTKLMSAFLFKNVFKTVYICCTVMWTCRGNNAMIRRK